MMVKNNVIALAVVAAVATPVAAQAGVSISGVLQSEVVSWSGKSNAEGLYLTDGQTYGNSRNSGVGSLAFRASEDLGNGMKAFAKYNFSITTDGSAMGTRDAYVGMSANFGTVLAGRLTTPYASSTGSYDPFKATFAQARGNGGMQNGNLGNGSYLSNALAYANKFGMAKVVLALGLDENPDTNGSTTGNHAVSASVVMPVGPVEIAVALISANDYGVASGSNGKDIMQTKLGVKYTAGAITVAAQVEQSDVSVSDGQFLYLTGSYAMGANTYSASLGSFSSDKTASTTTAVGADAWGATNASYMALGMKHTFSKNTSATVAYRMTSVDELATTAVQQDESALGASLRIKF